MPIFSLKPLIFSLLNLFGLNSPNAGKIMQQGVEALSAEIKHLAKSPNHLTQPKNSERFIIDAQITQLESSAVTNKNLEIVKTESTILQKVEQAFNKRIHAMNENSVSSPLLTEIKNDIPKVSGTTKILSITDSAINNLKNGFKIKETPIYKQSQQKIIENSERFNRLNVKPISNNDLKHLINNHTKYGSVANNRARHNKESLFHDNINIIELILDAWEYGTAIEDGVKIFDTGKIIGENKGIPSSKICVSLNGDKTTIRTAFPK